MISQRLLGCRLGNTVDMAAVWWMNAASRLEYVVTTAIFIPHLASFKFTVRKWWFNSNDRWCVLFWPYIHNIYNIPDVNGPQSRWITVFKFTEETTSVRKVKSNPWFLRRVSPKSYIQVKSHYSILLTQNRWPSRWIYCLTRYNTPSLLCNRFALCYIHYGLVSDGLINSLHYHVTDTVIVRQKW